MYSFFLSPFLGTLKFEYEVFEYQFESLTENGATILIFDHFLRRYPLKEWDLIDLHFTLLIKNKPPFSLGKISSFEKDSVKKLNRYKLNWVAAPQRNLEVTLSFSEDGWIKNTPSLSPEAFFKKTIKNFILAKEGTLIYLKHLVPYFSRFIDCDPRRFQFIQHFFFQEAQHQAKKKIHALKTLLETPPSLDLLDFSYLRDLIESDFSLDALNLSFNTLKHIPYVVAIKDIEETLFRHYNSLQLFFCANFQPSLLT